MKEEVIIVDENDNEIGTEEKIRAHSEGKLHRAFSIFIFNSKGEILLQRRAEKKYHSGGLWSNACCGHPRPVEKLEQAAHRRLKEEMGFDCELKELFKFKYEVSFASGLKEKEIDHVFLGTYDNAPSPNPDEVEAWKFMPIHELEQDLKKHNYYTYWFSEALPRLLHAFATKDA